MSHDLGITLGNARRMLERLAVANLLDIRVTDDVRYQFRPGTALGLMAAYCGDSLRSSRTAAGTALGCLSLGHAGRTVYAYT